MQGLITSRGSSDGNREGGKGNAESRIQNHVTNMIRIVHNVKFKGSAWRGSLGVRGCWYTCGHATQGRGQEETILSLLLFIRALKLKPGNLGPFHGLHLQFSIK